MSNGNFREDRLQRRYPVGAEATEDGVSFRVWAPGHQRLRVVLEGQDAVDLDREDDGYFAGVHLGARIGSRYRLQVDGNDALLPDPASRFQPHGPHGPSEVIDLDGFAWRHPDWQGVKIEGQVMYELHVGTFTSEGTWRAAIEKLGFLREVGITLIEMMPIYDFPGRFSWGYDGVGMFAPTQMYGSPDDLRAFVDAAHGHGIGVILDVVYNHVGPDGNYLSRFSAHYFTERYKTEWGAAINFDGEESEGVRTFFLATAAYWIREFRFDGLRLDATQSIFDSSEDHIIKAITRTARTAAKGRSIVVVGENEPQDTWLARATEDGGYGLDALWNDDFHHAAVVAMTGRNEAYYQDYQGSPQEFVSTAKYGYLFQGQIYGASGKRRGAPGLDLPPAAMVTFTQNHDQIANSAHGLRMHLVTSPGRARAMTALTLLLPGTPMLFQGQEFGASAPFLYFADHHPELAKLVRQGRADSLAQFESFAAPAMQADLDDPSAPETFTRCKLNWSEAESHQSFVAMHRDLLALRRDDPTFSAQRTGRLDGAVLGPEAFVLRFFGENGEDRLLVVNLGTDLRRASLPSPLLAPPHEKSWQLIWSSERPIYGGSGTPPVERDDGWNLPGHAAIVFGVKPR